MRNYTHFMHLHTLESRPLPLLQTLAGGPSAFDPFLRAYFEAFKFKTVTSDEFKAFFLDHFKAVGALKEVSQGSVIGTQSCTPTHECMHNSIFIGVFTLSFTVLFQSLCGVGLVRGQS